MIALYNNGRMTMDYPSNKMSKEIKALWPYPRHADEAWQIVVEANALGAASICLQDMMEFWRLTSAEAILFARKQHLTLTYTGIDSWVVTGQLDADGVTPFVVIGISPLDVLTGAIKPTFDDAMKRKDWLQCPDFNPANGDCFSCEKPSRRDALLSVLEALTEANIQDIQAVPFAEQQEKQLN